MRCFAFGSGKSNGYIIELGWGADRVFFSAHAFARPALSRVPGGLGMFGRKGLDGGTTRQDSSTPMALAPLSTASDPAQSSDRLVIGRGLAFNGVIDTCKHLAIGGSVVSDVEHCDTIEIAAGGSFHGTAAVTDADIAGQFEGELTVLGSLRIRETGRVRGRITYGTLSVETGGRLLGIAESSTEASRPQPRAVVVPLRPSTRNQGHDSSH